MTRLVNTLLAHALTRLEEGVENVHESTEPRYQRKRRAEDRREALNVLFIKRGWPAHWVMGFPNSNHEI